MARRRINTRFLGITSVVFLLLCVMAVVVSKVFVHEKPEPYIAQGDAYAKAGQWDKAAANYGKAAGLAPKNADVMVKNGVALAHMSGDDPEKMGQAASAWRRAVEIDPNRTDAWQRLLDAYQTNLQFLEISAKNDRNREDLTRLFTLVRETATQLNRLNPNDARTKAIIPALNIRLWLLNIPIPNTADESKLAYDKRPSDEQKINDAIVQLTQLLHDDPSNQSAGIWIARAKVRMAQYDLQKNQDTDAYTLFDECAKILDDPIHAQPKNIDLYMGQCEILNMLQQVDPRPETRSDYNKRLHDALETAQGIVDPAANVQQYIQVKSLWARLLASTDQARAEKIFKEIIDKNPSDITPKIELARILKGDATRRGDALAVLQSVPDEPAAGLTVGRRRVMEVQIAEAKLLRADIMSEKFATSTDPKEREQLTAAMQAILDSLAKPMADDWRYLKMLGKFQMAEGRYRDAIQSLTTAVDRRAAISGADSELLLLAADAYRHGQQTGRAIALLEQAMQVDPRLANSAANHMAVAQLYLYDHNRERAKPHIDWLAVRYPDNADIIKLQIGLLDVSTDHDEILKLYQKLPETTVQEMNDKVQVAHQIDNDADGERLLKAMHAAKPADTSITYRLGNLYLSSGRKDEARQLLDDARKLGPTDPALSLLGDAIDGNTAQAEDVVRAQIATLPDPFVRAMKLADLAHSLNKTGEELEHLKAAEVIRPADSSVMDRLFLSYLAAGEFDKAEGYITGLEKIDADQAHGLLYRFRLAMARQDIQGALAIGRQLTNDFKEFSGSWEALGEALQASGQLESAASKYVAALDKQATNIKALRNLIYCSYLMNKVDDAKRYIDDARQKFPDDPTYRDLQVQHEIRYGDPDSVMPGLRKDIAANPNDQQAYQLAAACLSQVAAARNAKGDADGSRSHIMEARAILEEAVKRWPDNLRLTSELAGADVQADDLASGEAAIKAIAERARWKDKPGPSVALAQLYIQANKLSLAEAPLRDALAKSTNAPDLELQLANVLAGEQKPDEALKVLELHKNLLPIRNRRVQLLMDLKRGEEAENEVAVALKAEPNNAELSNLLTFVYMHEGKSAQARKLASDTIAIDPTNLAAYYHRGVLSLQGAPPDPDAAISDLTFVRDHAPDNVEARLSLADAYQQKGDPSTGIHELESALRLAPQNKQVRLKLLDFYAATVPPRWLDADQVITDALSMPQFKNDVDILRGAANISARRGDSAEALTKIRAAMAQAPNNPVLLHDYLNILLLTKNFDLLQQESTPLTSDPKCPWWVFDFRGRGKAQSGDTAGAVPEFDKALNTAGVEQGPDVAVAVAQDIATDLGVDKAIELVEPRTRNSVTWKLVAIPLYDRKGDRPSAVKMAESGMTSFDTMSPAEQDQLLGLTATLYVTSNPPMVDKGITAYRKILERHPDDMAAMNNLACILAEMANPPQMDEALALAQKAFDITQKAGRLEPLVYDTQGWVLILAGRVNDGIDVLHRIVDKSSFPDAHYHLAEGYLRKQLPEDAQRELATASDLYDKAIAAHRGVDVMLHDKIADASKRADKMVQEKTQAKAGI